MKTPPLNHGVIGNGRATALITPTSAIEWLCLPRYDSAAVFARLLDREKGGTLRVLSRGEEIAGELAYIRNTNVLRGEFSDGDDHRWEVIDFATRRTHDNQIIAPLEIVRLIRPLHGAPRITIDLDPRPDFSTVNPTFEQVDGSLAIIGGTDRFYAQSNLALPLLLDGTEFTLRSPVFIIFGCGTPPEPRELADVERDLDQTIATWRAWSRTCALPTFAAHAVLRSALCLKLHVYEDTGAIIAAATTSIPEAMGTERTWDYRYCWLRDSAFVVEALRRLSQLSEGERFLGFLRDVADAAPLQPLYGVGGERSIPERVLPHLAGFGGNGFVRVGNAAALQTQNDLNGELLLCLDTLLHDPRLVIADASMFRPLIERLVEESLRNAPKPDMSIWEYRSQLAHYTFSRAMCWVAIDRGIHLATTLGHHDLAAQWRPIADRERAFVLAHGYNAELGYFTQTLDGIHADASLLLLPTLGIIDGNDPRFLSTLHAYEKILVKNDLMLRYVNPDDFGETTSAFTMCTFWWAEALALAGRLDRAIEVFTRVSAHANELGLFSEDIDPATGALLGNFPQAYTHVGHIHAAITISLLVEAREGRVRAWI